MSALLTFLAGIPLLAAAYTATAALLWLCVRPLRPSGPGRILSAYPRFVVAATVFLLLWFLGAGPLAVVAVVALYRFEFTLSWVKAVIVGGCAGGVGWVVFHWLRGVLAALD
jgi:hypothetical protein